MHTGTTSGAGSLCGSGSNNCSSSPLPRHPKRPLRAYQYFFNDEVRKLSRAGSCRRATSCASSSSSDVTSSGPAVVLVLAGPAAKRRRSDFGATLVSDDEHEHERNNDADSALKDVGKIIGEKWRSLSDTERSTYEHRAEADADRYEREIERYYKKLSEREVDRWRAIASGRGHSSGPNLVGLDSDGSGSGSGSRSGAPSTGTTRRRLLCASKASRRSSDSDAVVTVTQTSTAVTVSKAYYISGGDSKAGLRALLADRRNEVLSDVSALNEIAAARSRGEGSTAGAGEVRTAIGRQHSLYQQTRTDAGTMQRMFNLAVGPGGGSSKRLSLASSSISSSSTSSRSIMDAAAASLSSFSDSFSGNDRLENTTLNFSSPGSNPKKKTIATSPGLVLEFPMRPTTTSSGGGINSLKNTSFNFTSAGTSNKTATSAFKFVRPPTMTAMNSGGGGGGGLDRLKNTTFSFSSNKRNEWEVSWGTRQRSLQLLEH